MIFRQKQETKKIINTLEKRLSLTGLKLTKQFMKRDIKRNLKCKKGNFRNVVWLFIEQKHFDQAPGHESTFYKGQKGKLLPL